MKIDIDKNISFSIYLEYIKNCRSNLPRKEGSDNITLHQKYDFIHLLLALNVISMNKETKDQKSLWDGYIMI